MVFLLKAYFLFRKNSRTSLTVHRGGGSPSHNRFRPASRIVNMSRVIQFGAELRNDAKRAPAAPILIRDEV